MDWNLASNGYGIGRLPTPFEGARYHRGQRNLRESIGYRLGLPLPHVIELHSRRPPRECPGRVCRRPAMSDQQNGRHIHTLGGCRM